MILFVADQTQRKTGDVMEQAEKKVDGKEFAQMCAEWKERVNHLAALREEADGWFSDLARWGLALGAGRNVVEFPEGGWARASAGQTSDRTMPYADYQDLRAFCLMRSAGENGESQIQEISVGDREPSDEKDMMNEARLLLEKLWIKAVWFLAQGKEAKALRCAKEQPDSVFKERLIKQLEYLIWENTEMEQEQSACSWKLLDLAQTGDLGGDLTEATRAHCNLALGLDKKVRLREMRVFLEDGSCVSLAPEKDSAGDWPMVGGFSIWKAILVILARELANGRSFGPDGARPMEGKMREEMAKKWEQALAAARFKKEMGVWARVSHFVN